MTRQSELIARRKVIVEDIMSLKHGENWNREKWFNEYENYLRMDTEWLKVNKKTIYDSCGPTDRKIFDEARELSRKKAISKKNKEELGR